MAENQIPSGHITLKEASRISGYAPDYVGQLIRKGKLYGRQVYLTTAWVTTEDALRDYMAAERAGGESLSAWDERLQRWENLLFSDSRTTGLLKAALTVIFVGSVVLALLLLSVFSIELDKRLENRAVQRAQHDAALSP